MDYYKRQSLIASVGDGNHIAQDIEDDIDEQEDEMLPCTNCGTEIPSQEHYRDCGLCLSCIKRI